MSAKTKQKLSAGIQKIKTVASDVYTDVRLHWKKPAKGNYISYREIGAYSVGGMGVNMIAFFVGYLAFNTSSLLLASTIGIRPLHIQTMMTINTVLNVFFFALRGKLVDNTRTRWGRFRPYIAVMGVPLVALTLIYLFLDFETMSYTEKLIATFAFGIAVAMLQPLLTDTHGELGSCLSPNTAERTKMFTIYSIVFSIAPTVYNFLIPILSDFTGGYTNINTYRYIIAPVGILGLGLTLFASFGCKERVVAARNFVYKAGLLEGCVAVWKNKDWWIRTASGFVGFLEGANGVLLNWIYVYDTQDMVTYSFLVTIMGSASFVAMVLCPFLLSKLGNRKLLLYHNAFNILFVGCMMASYKIPLLFFVFTYINTAINNLSMVYNPVMAAEVKDSIQYKSGLRLDFTLGAAGMIALPITIATGYAIPYVYESMGLAADYNVLYDPAIRNNLFYVLCALSVLGAALNLIPFFFYGLSREKHRVIIAALKYRAAGEDYAAGKLSAEEIKDTVELYNEMKGYFEAPDPDIAALKAKVKEAKAETIPNNLSEEEVKAAKRERAQRIKEAKRQLKQAQTLAEYKKSVKEIFVAELHRYEQPLTMAETQLATQIAAGGADGIFSVNLECDIQVPKEKQAALHKMCRRYERKLRAMCKRAKKAYPNGAEEAAKLFAAAGSEEGISGKSGKEIAQIRRSCKKFARTYRFYLACEKLKSQAEASKHWDKIEQMYPEAYVQAEENRKEEEAKERASHAAHKAEIALAKARKAHKKSGMGEFDPADYGLDENGYALIKTGDELQSLLDREQAVRALAKAKAEHAKKHAGEFDPAEYGLDEHGYPLKKEGEECTKSSRG